MLHFKGLVSSTTAHLPPSPVFVVAGPVNQLEARRFESTCSNSRPDAPCLLSILCSIVYLVRTMHHRQLFRIPPTEPGVLGPTAGMECHFIQQRCRRRSIALHPTSVDYLPSQRPPTSTFRSRSKVIFIWLNPDLQHGRSVMVTYLPT